MVKPLFVAAADLHFDEFGAWRYKGILGDAEFALAQVVDHCLAAQAGALWLLGDIMNRPMPRQSAVLEVCRQLDRCRGGDVPVRYVLGDHDGRQDWPGLHPWPEHADGRAWRTGPFLAYGLDYLPRGRLQAALRDVPREAALLMTHQKWEEFLSKSGHARLTEVPLHVRYVVTGDFHDQVWGEFGAGQQVWSPGSTHATSVADDKPRQFLAGFDSGGELRCEFVPLRSRRIARFRAEDGDQLARLIETDVPAVVAAEAADGTKPGPLRKPIVDVEYFTDVPQAHARLQAVADRCFLFTRPRDRERHARRAAAPGVRPTLALEEAVARLARPGTPGHDWTLRLLHAQDRQAEWQAIVAEHRSR